MASKVITVRAPADMLEVIDEIAAKRHMSRSAIVIQAVEDFIAEIEARDYMIPPYDRDDILHELRLGRYHQDSPWDRHPLYLQADAPQGRNERREGHL